MADAWAEELTCAVICSRCDKQMGANDLRILKNFVGL